MTHRVAAAHGPLVREIVERGLRVRLIDSSLALASRLFVAVIPLALLVTAVLPAGETFAEKLASGLQLEGAGRVAAQELFAAPDTVRAGITLATFAVVAYSVVSCGGVLQRTYRAAWRLEEPGMGTFWVDMRRRAVWAAGFIAYVGAIFALPQASAEWLAGAVRDVARTAVAVGFFAWTPYILLGRRVPAKRLLPTALIGAAALGVVTAVGPLYVPGLASAGAESYGLVGFAFAFLTWLFAQSVLIVSAAVAGAVIAERPGRAPPHSSSNFPATRDEPRAGEIERTCR